MRFSILTITFNAEKYLAETLQSVAIQNFKDFEHLIWDGGSTDNTLKIASSFPHVKIFRGKDEGISDAMNKIAHVAQGDFLQHLHADDLLAHENVLTFVDTTLRQHPKSLWLYGLCDIMDENGKKLKGDIFHPYSYKKLRKYNTISHPSTYYYRELFLQTGGFNKNLRFAMDYDLWRRFALQCEPFAFPHVLAYFRKHSASLSTEHPKKVADEAYAIRNTYAKNRWERWQSYRTWKRRRRSETPA